MADVAFPHPLGERGRRPPRRLDEPPELLFAEIVVRHVTRQRLLLRPADEPSRPARPGERAVQAAQRLEPHEIAQHEHVERDLEAQLALDPPRGVGALARLVVLDDPARAERVDVDPVDLPREREARPELEPAL